MGYLWSSLSAGSLHEVINTTHLKAKLKKKFHYIVVCDNSSLLLAANLHVKQLDRFYWQGLWKIMGKRRVEKRSGRSL
jgi:hypothetical protein